MERQDSSTTRLDEYIAHMLPWADGHQRNALCDFVQAIIAQQTGCQAQLARSFGKQEAAAKRLSRLLHNERLEYARRPGCEAGFWDAKWWLGFAQARSKPSAAWSRLFALCAIALLVVMSLATRLLLRPGKRTRTLLRRVVSRRYGRYELSRSIYQAL